MSNPPVCQNRGMGGGGVKPILAMSDFENTYSNHPSLTIKKKLFIPADIWGVFICFLPIFSNQNKNQQGALLHQQFLEQVALVDYNLFFILVLKIGENNHPLN